MSYDVYLYPRRDGQSWEEVVDEAEHRVEAGLADLDEPARQRWESVVEKLDVIWPGLDRFDGAEVIELTDESTGMQVSLYAQEAAVAIPYWHSGEDAREILRAAWQVLEVIREVSGWSIYDPQLDAGLETETDLLAGVGIMEDTSGRIERGELFNK